MWQHSEECMYRLGSIAMRDYQENVTTGQTDRHTDRRRKKLSLRVAILRRRHKKLKHTLLVFITCHVKLLK